jgi:hypothetical protein
MANELTDLPVTLTGEESGRSGIINSFRPDNRICAGSISPPWDPASSDSSCRSRRLRGLGSPGRIEHIFVTART